MSDEYMVDLFAEDNAHEEFLKALIERLANEAGKRVHIRARSARGGHGRAVTEYVLYQRILKKGMDAGEPPDIIVVAVDCNCKGHTAMHRELEGAADALYASRTVYCCPDPHIERWYLADAKAVQSVIGLAPKLTTKKCARDYYKTQLEQTVRNAGHLPSLGGIEFASDIVGSMDLYSAGKTEKGLGAFLKDLAGALKRLP